MSGSWYGEVRDALVRAATFASHFRFAELALDRRRQTRQVALHDVVVRAVFHGGDGHVLADGAGHEDERQIEPGLSDDGERGGAGERRHREVGDRHVPRALGERRAQRLGREHPLRRDVVTGATQGAGDEHGVVRRILDQEKIETSTSRLTIRENVRLRAG